MYVCMHVGMYVCTRWAKSRYTVYSIITIYLLLVHPVCMYYVCMHVGMYVCMYVCICMYACT